MSNRKVMIIYLTVGSIKKISLYKMHYFPEPYSYNKNKINVQLDLSNYATKFDLKRATDADTSKFSKEVDLASLMSDQINQILINQNLLLLI